MQITGDFLVEIPGAFKNKHTQTQTHTHRHTGISLIIIGLKGEMFFLFCLVASLFFFKNFKRKRKCFVLFRLLGVVRSASISDGADTETHEGGRFTDRISTAAAAAAAAARSAGVSLL
jgi:hypothetical protein